MLSRVVVLVALVVIALLPSLCYSQCSVNTTVAPSAAFACLRTIALNPNASIVMNKFFARALRVNPFTTLYSRSGAPYNLRAPPMINQIERVLSPPLPNAFDAHTNIQLIVDKGYDAHFGISSPPGFGRNLLLVRPWHFAFQSTGATSAPKAVLVACANFTAFSAENPAICASVLPHLGKTITKINGIATWDYMLNLSRWDQIHPDLGLRLNSVISGFNRPDYRTIVANTQVGDAETLTVIDSNGNSATVTIPILTKVLASTSEITSQNIPQYASMLQFVQLTLKSTFTNENCPSQQRSGSGSEAKTGFSTQKELLRNTRTYVHEKDPKSFLRFHDVKLEKKNHLESLKKQSGGVSCTAITTNGTAVNYLECTVSGGAPFAYITMTDFSWGETEDETAQNLANIVNGIKRSAAGGINKVILDLTGNGGGTVVIGYLTHFLLSARNISDLVPPADLRYRKIIENYVTCAFGTDNDCCFNVTTGAPFLANSWLINSTTWRRVPRGNGFDLHSPVFGFLAQKGVSDEVNLKKYILPQMVPNDINAAYSLIASLPTPRPYTQIQILSNGYCISTCSFFSTLIVFVPPTATTKIVLYGGVPALPMDNSIAACNIISVSGVTALPFREMLMSNDTNTPRQFARLVPNVVLPIWMDTLDSNRLSILALAVQQFA